MNSYNVCHTKKVHAFPGFFRSIPGNPLGFFGFLNSQFKKNNVSLCFSSKPKRKRFIFPISGMGIGVPKKAVFTLKIQKFVLRHENDMLSISRSFQTYITFIFLTVDEISLNWAKSSDLIRFLSSRTYSVPSGYLLGVELRFLSVDFKQFSNLTQSKLFKYSFNYKNFDRSLL